MMKLKICILLPFLMILHTRVFSQKESQKWYFGANAGLDFSTTPPTILTNGMLNTVEGCASISNGAGSLLFYTDGLTVYNQNHVVMANGSGLAGNSSSTQSAIIVKQPGNANLYYIFTQWPSNGVKYSVVDMNLAAGLGSVTVLNATLTAPTTTEKLSAVRHCNGKDIWVLTHNNSNVFLAYLLTSTGVNTSAITTTIGSTHSGLLGSMKLSPNGKKLALGIYNLNVFELYDFDNSTGVVSNSLSLGSFQNPYGLEFSPDGTKLYGTVETAANLPIYQWDLCAGSATAIVASQTIIGNGQGAIEHGALQLAPDGKIYVCRYGTSMLGVIGNPDALGVACNYTALAQSIAPKICQLGFPNFISYRTPGQLTYTLSSCQSGSFSAIAAPTPTTGACTAVNGSVSGVSWNFGDVSSGAANTSTLSNTTHNFSGVGTYTTQLILYYACGTDTIRQPITINNAAPSISLSGKSSMCAGNIATLTASGATTYSWSRPAGSFTFAPSIVVNPSVTTIYTVVGTNTTSGCSTTKLYTLTINKCTALYETNAETELRLYPNPINQNLTIETSTSLKLFIYNELGSLLLERTFEKGTEQLDLSAFPMGVYFVKSISNTASQTKRLVKIE